MEAEVESWNKISYDRSVFNVKSLWFQSLYSKPLSRLPLLAGAPPNVKRTEADTGDGLRCPALLASSRFPSSVVCGWDLQLEAALNFLCSLNLSWIGSVHPLPESMKLFAGLLSTFLHPKLRTVHLLLCQTKMDLKIEEDRGYTRNIAVKRQMLFLLPRDFI